MLSSTKLNSSLSERLSSQLSDLQTFVWQLSCSEGLLTTFLIIHGYELGTTLSFGLDTGGLRILTLGKMATFWCSNLHFRAILTSNFHSIAFFSWMSSHCNLVISWCLRIKSIISKSAIAKPLTMVSICLVLTLSYKHDVHGMLWVVHLWTFSFCCVFQNMIFVNYRCNYVSYFFICLFDNSEVFTCFTSRWLLITVHDGLLMTDCWATVMFIGKVHRNNSWNFLVCTLYM